MSRTLASDKPAGESYVQYISKLSGWDEAEVSQFFAKFDVGTEAPVYEAVISNALEALNNHVSELVFGGLAIYKDTIRQLTELKSPDSQDWVTPTTNEHPIALGVLSISDSDESMGDERATYLLLWACLILAILECEQDDLDGRDRLSKAAVQLRRAGPDTRKNNYERLEALSEKIANEVGGPHSLFHAITRLSESSIALYSSIAKILKYIDLTASDTSEPGTQQSAYRKTHILSEDTYQVTASSILFADHPNEVEETILFSDPELDVDIPSEISKKSKEILKKNKIPALEIREVENELKTESSLIRRFNRYMASAAANSSNHLMTNTSLFSPYERQILKDSIINPHKYASDTLSATVVALAICTVRNRAEVLRLTFGDEGDISPNGKYRRCMPEIPNSVNPPEESKQLYVEHQDNRLDLQLPGFIRDLLDSFPVNGCETRTIEEIIINAGKDPKSIIRKHLSMLNENFSERIVAARISNQLRAYITARYNDQCLTYALTANERARIPTALYYRSIPVKDLVDVYAKSVEDYFLC